MKKQFWSIDPESVKITIDKQGCMGAECELDIDAEGLYESMECITVSEAFADNEDLRTKFPYELMQSAYDAIRGTKTLYKTPQTANDWHKHYSMKAQSASEIAEEYFEKASYYKKKAKKALKGRY